MPTELSQLFSTTNFLHTERLDQKPFVMDSDHDKEFDTRLMRQIIGVSDESELRAEWSEEQLTRARFSQLPLASPPLRAFQKETSAPGLTFSSLLECPPELESVQWLPPSRHEGPEGVGESWGVNAKVPNQKAHHARRRRLRHTWDRYRSYLKHKMHDA